MNVFVLAGVVILGMLVEGGGSEKKVTMKLVRVQHSPVSLDFAVRSRVYAQFPNLMFVTTRGCGLSIFSLDDPLKPKLLTRWNESMIVEGQDILDGVLVIVDLSPNPGLWTVDVSDLKKTGKVTTIGFVKMPDGICSLHVTLFQNRGLHAVVSNNGHYWNSETHKWTQPSIIEPTGLVIIDLNIPSSPKIISILSLPHVSLPEGLIVVSDPPSRSFHVLVGGYGADSSVAIVDVSDPHHPWIVKEWNKPYLLELNSVRRGNIVYSALYGSPGGLAVFNVTSGSFDEISRLVTHNMSYANRVNIHPSSGEKQLLIFLPLEGLAAVGVVEVSINQKKLRQVGWERVTIGNKFSNNEEKVFCLALNPNGKVLYVFGAFSKSMFVYELELTSKHIINNNK